MPFPHLREAFNISLQLSLATVGEAAKVEVRGGEGRLDIDKDPYFAEIH